MAKTSRTGVVAVAVACLSALARADETSPQVGSVLFPNTFSDFQQLVGTLMQNQHSLIVQKHGEGSPQADVSLAAVDNQNYLTKALLDFQNNPPAAWWVFFNAVGNFSAILNNTNYLFSPNLGSQTVINRPTWFTNRPKVATNNAVYVAANPTLINVQPCFLRLNAQGVQIDPFLITIGPRLFQVDPLGVNIEPKLFTTQPTLISVQPFGIAAGLTHVKVSPTFLEVAPNVKIVPGSGKPAKLSPGIAIKPIPEPTIITNEVGVSKPVDAAALKASTAAALVVTG